MKNTVFFKLTLVILFLSTKITYSTNYVCSSKTNSTCYLYDTIRYKSFLLKKNSCFSTDNILPTIVATGDQYTAQILL